MSNKDPFSRGLERAFSRRKEQTKQQVQQTVQVQKVTADVVTSLVRTSDAVITEQDHDELYRTTIIQKMINHIKSKRKPV
ncbi:hypothetical protein KW841_07800 [Pseudomonas sp. PDM28]|uniref:hypothetical protein n=1 Tax=Pseudomonas sp. PDM28 TaxID=2854770 RepID=UPI001C461B9B|nr:hypothetical protein [Pseudomonas sp. PDM28]MBV7552246.1 hypothetical protein [Pseudomonas sp. PDM28]